jgi:hypothetical protein
MGAREGTSKGMQKVINSIAGGFTGGGDTSSARKRHLRAVFSINPTVEIKLSKTSPLISFSMEEFKGEDANKDDPMVISVFVLNFMVKPVLIDQGSSADIMFLATFKQLGIPSSMIGAYHNNLVAFSGELVTVRGYVELETIFGIEEATKRVTIKYLLVNSASSCNMIIGRPTLNRLGAIVSTPHLVMKFPISQTRVSAVWADQKLARRCYNYSLKVANKPNNMSPKVMQVSKERSDSEQNLIDLDPHGEF